MLTELVSVQEQLTEWKIWVAEQTGQCRESLLSRETSYTSPASMLLALAPIEVIVYGDATIRKTLEEAEHIQFCDFPGEHLT